jgi:hypothetical protein
MKKIGNLIQNKKFKFKEFFFQKPKSHYKPTCEAENVREGYISQSVSS